MSRITEVIGATLDRLGSVATKAALTPNLLPIDYRGWFPVVRESFTGAWQNNVTLDADTIERYWAVFACVTLIAGDISKLTPWVMQRQPSGVWKATFQRPVLRKPNRYQNRQQFYLSWLFSKLLRGNTYVLKERDASGFIIALYILDPNRVTVLTTEDGQIFYRLQADNVAGIIPDPVDTQFSDSVVVPASEIIHDRMYPMYHPLIGISPLFAAGLPAMQGAAMLMNASKFFTNMSRPSGILTAPGSISNDVATRLKEKWEENFGEGKVGKVAVLGDGLKYEQMSMTASDSQLIEQTKMTAEMICGCFHVPPYKIGLGTPPGGTVSSLNQSYYDQCLSPIMEGTEQCLDDGLELNMPAQQQEVVFDVSALLRMDPEARFASHSAAIGGGWKAPNEARMSEDLEPVTGGDTPYLQQQNYSLEALNNRDQRAVDGAENIQATAMNGAQVTSLQGLIVACATGQMPVDTARAAVSAAFPLLSDEEINAIFDPLEEVAADPAEVLNPKPAAPAPAPAPADTSAPQPADQVADEFYDYIIRELTVE